MGWVASFIFFASELRVLMRILVGDHGDSGAFSTPATFFATSYLELELEVKG